MNTFLVKFEVPEGVTSSELHEWLCQAIHKLDMSALNALNKVTVNIVDYDDLT